MRLIAPCIKAKGGRISLLLFGVAIMLNLASVYVSIRLTLWSGAFYTAIEKIDTFQVMQQTGIFALIIAANSLRGIAYQYLCKVLEMQWRETLTDCAISLWTENRAYWVLANDKNNPIDNPDQRVAEDCRLFIKGLLSEALDLINRVVGLFSYVILLWNLAAFPLSSDLSGMHFEIPHYMVWTAFIYVAVSSFITHKLGYPLKSLFCEQQKYEADFRFAMARWRGAFDEVALSKGEAAERQIFKQKFRNIKQNWRKLIRREAILSSFTFPFNHTVLRIPLFVALPGYLAGHIAFGGLMQVSMAFSSVVTTLSWFIFSYRDLADLVATSGRLDMFFSAANRVHLQKSSGLSFKREQSGVVAGKAFCKDVTAYTPDDKQLFCCPFIEIKAGDRVWLNAPSGFGKTTFVKILAGFWPHFKGEIHWPTNETMFIPQKSYFPIGSLADAVAYPLSSEVIKEDIILAALKDVGLLHAYNLAVMSDGNEAEVLSGGEKQRLSFARLLIHRPAWVVLDEATSALDTQAEAELFNVLNKALPRTAFIIISHRQPVGFDDLKIIDALKHWCE
ncbi:ATP-binding cassette domain-containing protein [Bartonella sp. HY406]|nr:ATP-binding cassette domain-containing protein [Bartonella sp. HY406]